MFLSLFHLLNGEVAIQAWADSYANKLILLSPILVGALR